MCDAITLLSMFAMFCVIGTGYYYPSCHFKVSITVWLLELHVCFWYMKERLKGGLLAE